MKRLLWGLAAVPFAAAGWRAYPYTWPLAGGVAAWAAACRCERLIRILRYDTPETELDPVA